MKINKHCFPNGLRLVHYEDTSTQMVALNIVYDVGARDEHPEHTGFAHLFEHLMFGGSAHIPDYDTPLQLAGEKTMPGPIMTLPITTSPFRSRT
jgi:predicted Zn-dependent peptidase